MEARMAQTQRSRRPGRLRFLRRALSPAALLLLVLLSVAAVFARQEIPKSQGTPASVGRRFDVASVKPNHQTLAEFVRASQGNASTALPTIGIRTFPGGRLTASFVTLRALIVRAFEIKDYQLEGGPSWVGTTNFEINAKAEGEATEQELNAMLKALLIERFALRTRIQVKEMPLHVLTLARTDGKLGSQLKPTSDTCLAEMEERRKNPAQRRSDTPPPAARSVEEMRDMLRTPRCGGSSMGSSASSMTFSFSGQPLSTLVSRLSSQLSAPVLDKTGLTGAYDAVLEYEPVGRQASLSAAPNANGPEFLAPPLRSALQQQLGLKLEDTKGPLDIVIIESVEQPMPD
jgi:uncharacterized protein (TIGR03435 family)